MRGHSRAQQPDKTTNNNLFRNFFFFFSSTIKWGNCFWLNKTSQIFFFFFFRMFYSYGVFVHWNEHNPLRYVKFGWAPGLLLASLTSWLPNQPTWLKIGSQRAPKSQSFNFQRWATSAFYWWNCSHIPAFPWCAVDDLKFPKMCCSLIYLWWYKKTWTASGLQYSYFLFHCQGKTPRTFFKFPTESKFWALGPLIASSA